MIIPADATPAEGIAYFTEAFELTSGLDGHSVIDGFLAGIRYESGEASS